MAIRVPYGNTITKYYCGALLSYHTPKAILHLNQGTLYEEKCLETITVVRFGNVFEGHIQETTCQDFTKHWLTTERVSTSDILYAQYQYVEYSIAFNNLTI